MGDGHAAQGDGELTSNALETSMDIEFTVDLIRDRQIPGPRVGDDEYVPDGHGNRRLAQRSFATEVASVLGTSRLYEIAEVVDPSVNMVAKIRKSSLAGLRKMAADERR
jgi:acetamidase/formamidase